MQLIRGFSPGSMILSRKLTPVMTALSNYRSSTSSAVEDIQNVEKLEEELFGKESFSAGVGREEKSSRKKGFKNIKRQPVSQQESPSKILTKIDANTNLSYRDLKFKDPILRDTMMLINSGRKQKKDALMILEGRRLIEDALKTNLKLKKLFFSRSEDLEGLADYLKIDPNYPELFKTTYRDLSLWSQLNTSPGLMAVFERPKLSRQEGKDNLPISVICDNIREPNNLGSVIRICAALPCREVLVMKGCTDPFEAKSLRGGAGGQFHIPVKYPVQWENLPEILPEDNAVFVAESNVETARDCSNDTIDVTEYSLPDQSKNNHMTVIIGGETHGISEEGYRLMKLYKDSACLHIPLAKCVESLNTASALAVILFELRRKLKQKMINSVDSSDEE